MRATVMQLLVNWTTWYAGGEARFSDGVEMLKKEGYSLPEPTRMQDGTETPRGAPGGDGAKPVLLGQVGGGGAGAPSAAPTAVKMLSDAMLTAEMSVMRDDRAPANEQHPGFC